MPVDGGSEAESFVEYNRHPFDDIAAVAAPELLLDSYAIDESEALVEQGLLVGEVGEMVVSPEDPQDVVAGRGRLPRWYRVGSEPVGSIGPATENHGTLRDGLPREPG